MPSWCIDLLLLLGGAVDDRHQLGVAAGDRGAPGDKRASYVAGRYDDIIGVAERDRVEPEQFRGSRATPAWPERVRTRRGWCQPDATALAGRHTGVDVRHGEATALPFESGSFDAVVCFTMLHHLPSAAAQDRLYAEAGRVLRPNGRLAGSDSRWGPLFALAHIGDTCTMVDPEELPARLKAAGFGLVETDTRRDAFRFRAQVR